MKYGIRIRIKTRWRGRFFAELRMTNVPLDYDSTFFRTCFMGDVRLRDSSAVPQNRGGGERIPCKLERIS